MNMTIEEIVRDWSQAKNPAKQITILAQLNDTSTSKMKSLLMDNGAQVIANAYAAGATLAELSAKYGLTKLDIREMIVNAGFEIRQRGERVESAPANPEQQEPFENAAPADKPAEAPTETPSDAPEPVAEQPDTPSDEPIASALEQQLDPYQMAKALATVVIEFCKGYDIALSLLGNDLEVCVYGDDESTTYKKNVECRGEQDEEN